MQRTVLFVVLACVVAAAHLAAAADPVAQACVMSMKPGSAFEVKIADLVDKEMFKSLTDEVAGPDNLGSQVFTHVKGKDSKTYCCQAMAGDVLKCRPKAEEKELCYAAHSKCGVSGGTKYKIEGKRIAYKQFACSDLKDWGEDKTTWATLSSGSIVIKNGDKYACCVSGKSRFSCGDLSSKKVAEEINWELLKLTSMERATEVFQNSINRLDKDEMVDPLDLGEISREAVTSGQCSDMLWKLKAEEVPLIFLALTDMMIQQTKRGFGKHDKANLLSKTLLRSYMRFYVVMTQDSKLDKTIKEFNDWWADETGKLELPQVDFKKSAISCMHADSLFSQDIERLEENNRMNARVRGNIMFAVKTVTSVLSYAAKATGTAFGGPAAGAAAGAISDAIFGAISNGIDGILERNNAVGKIRRDARSAILEGYQGMLYDDNNYKSAKCTDVIQDYLTVVHKYLTAKEDVGEAWNKKCLMCIPELGINKLEDYGHAFALLNRMQGFKQRTIGEILTWSQMLKEQGKQFIEANIDRTKELLDKFKEIKESDAADKKIDAIKDKVEEIKAALPEKATETPPSGGTEKK